MCGTPQYRRRETGQPEKISEEILDTSPAIRPVTGTRNPLLIGAVVLVAIVVLVLVFQAGAGIS